MDPEQPRDGKQERGLSGFAGAEDGHHRPFGHAQRYVFKRRPGAVRVRVGQISYVYRWIHARSLQATVIKLSDSKGHVQRDADEAVE